jgi:hypothetical protein
MKRLHPGFAVSDASVVRHAIARLRRDLEREEAGAKLLRDAEAKADAFGREQAAARAKKGGKK